MDVYVCMWDINTHITKLYVSIYVHMNMCIHAQIYVCMCMHTCYINVHIKVCI